MKKKEEEVNTTASEKKIKWIDIDKIIPNCEQSRKVDEEDTGRLAKSIEKIGLIDPITVTPRGKKYMLCNGEDRVNACKLLGRKKIQAIVEELDDNQAAEYSLTDNICRKQMTSVQLEDAVSKRWENGNYGNYRKLGESIGLSGGRVGLLIDAKKTRDGTNGPLVSTQVIIDSKTLKNDTDKIKLFKLVEKGRLAPSDVRDAVEHFNKGWPEGAKNAVLNGEVSYSRAKIIIDERVSSLDRLADEIKNKYEKKGTYKRILSENDDFDRAGLFEKFFSFVNNLEPTYITEIEDETDRRHAVNFVINSTMMLLRLLFKLNEIDRSRFEMIVKNVFNRDLKDVELLKNAGHEYAFSREWVTDEESKISEEIRNVKSGRTVPLKRISGDTDTKNSRDKSV